MQIREGLILHVQSFENINFTNHPLTNPLTRFDQFENINLLIGQEFKIKPHSA